MHQIVYKFTIFFLLVMVGWALASTTSADEDSTRIRIGLKLFRTILAADTQITQKHNAHNELPLTLIYKSNQSQALLYAEKLRNLGKGKSQGKIKKISIVINILSSAELDKLPLHKPAGIYIIEELDVNTIQQLVNYGINQQIITFSPFSGAVEQGVTAGLIIDARVKPYINNTTLKSSQLQLKSFFLKVSTKYEP